MTTFRLKLPTIRFSFLSWAMNPFLFLMFLYFLSTSTDLLNISFLIFKVKLTLFIAALTFLFYFLLFQKLQIPKDFFLAFLLILGSMILSASQSINPIAALGFIGLFVFNFFFYFLFPCILFSTFDRKLILKIYFSSFYVLGIYTLCQVLFSLVGLSLPGAHEEIHSIARGQGLTYEPSYYALYMTPFAIFYTTKYLLEKKENRSLKDLILPNFFLLISTSTGCFFSYLFFLFFLFCFSFLKTIKKMKISFSRLFLRLSLACSALFALFSLVKKELLISGFFKFFYTEGFTQHYSFLARWEGLASYWKIFLENPWVGVGLGSGPFYLAQEQLGTKIDALDPTIPRAFTPTNVTTEVLAGVGIVGSLAFLFFFYLLIRHFREGMNLKKEYISLLSLGISLCVMFATLQFNQSIMRHYLWTHIGIFIGYIRSLKNENS